MITKDHAAAGRVMSLCSSSNLTAYVLTAMACQQQRALKILRLACTVAMRILEGPFQNAFARMKIEGRHIPVANASTFLSF